MERSSFEDYLVGCAGSEPPARGMTPANRKDEPLPMLGCIAETGGCTACVSACPNGANVVISFGNGSREILHIDQKCTRCGRCRAACPFDGDPAGEKFTLFADDAGYGASRAAGFLPAGEGRFVVRYGCMQNGFTLGEQNGKIPLEYVTLIEAAAKQLGI